MTQSKWHCEHTHYLNNDVHKLVLQSKTTQAVDDALQHMKQILDDQAYEDRLLLLIDTRQSGVPPVSYFLSAIRQFYGGRDDLPPVRAAYLYDDNVVLSVIQAFLDRIPMDASRRFMRGKSEIDAIEWLLGRER